MFSREFWGWTVFAVSILAYLCLGIGGYRHPAEINTAAYGLWLILSCVLLYSFWAQGFAGWRLPLAFLIGNVSMLLLAFGLGDYTFNIGPAETTVLYGLISTISIWVVVGKMTSKWSARILYLGLISVDVLSFYPQVKQYLLPHEVPTAWLIGGWIMFATGAFLNVVLVEELFKRLRLDETTYEVIFKEKKKKSILIWEQSLFSLENGCFIVITIMIMTH